MSNNSSAPVVKESEISKAVSDAFSELKEARLQRHSCRLEYDKAADREAKAESSFGQAMEKFHQQTR